MFRSTWVRYLAQPDAVAGGAEVQLVVGLAGGQVASHPLDVRVIAKWH